MIAPTIRDERACGAVFEAGDEAASVAVLRRSVAAALRRWDVPEETLDAVELLASELVTNAIQHSGRPVAGRSAGSSGVRCATVRARVRVCGRAVVLEVWDGDPTPPVPCTAGAQDEGGRGLMLVQMLAEQCGYYWPNAGGKVVWAQVPVAG